MANHKLSRDLLHYVRATSEKAKFTAEANHQNNRWKVPEVAKSLRLAVDRRAVASFLACACKLGGRGAVVCPMRRLPDDC
eukprot:scaffold12474_cov77-Cyclotella_meneghiniana.AAC.6